MTNEIKHIAIAGEGKSLLIDGLSFILKVKELSPTDIKGFFVDDTGILVFTTDGDEKEKHTQMYNIHVNEIILAEQIAHYIQSRTHEEYALLKCIASGYEEDYCIGWELFTPNYCCEGYEIEKYESGETILAVKPIIIEWGK